jgi:hypothetical protein
VQFPALRPVVGLAYERVKIDAGGSRDAAMQ